jgi:hypothetical protein
VTESYKKKTQNFMDPDFAARMLKPDGPSKVRGVFAADEKSVQVRSVLDLGREKFATGQCARSSCSGDCLPQRARQK